MAILSNNEQTRWKNSYAAAPTIGVTLVTNGEHRTRVVDQQGNIALAGLVAPTKAPFGFTSTAGNLTEKKIVAYRYVYAATKRYPFIENITPAGGSVAPRSNPSPSEVFSYVSTTGGRMVSFSVTPSLDSTISEIWVYRTGYYTSVEEASTAAEAGLCFYVGKINNDPLKTSLTFDDNLANGTDQIELDNQIAPTAQYCFYYPPFFYLFGNNAMEAKVSVSEGYKLTIIDNAQWFEGREGQYARIKGIETGGIDSNGTYFIHITGSQTAELYLDFNFATKAGISYKGTSTVRVYGAASTLWRSKPKNPLAWGETVVLGNARLPRLWSLNLGAGEGTSINSVPGAPYLKVDLRNPNQSYVLNLKAAERDSFASSLRSVSDQFASTSHFAQFPATMQDGNSVLWGIDCNKFAILQTDGSTQIPVADPIPDTLRSIVRDLDKQYQFHGIRDNFHELNCLWVESKDSIGSIDLMIYHHWPSGQWGLHKEIDLRCTALVQSATSNEQLILGGTDSGLLQQIMIPDTSYNSSRAFVARMHNLNTGIQEAAYNLLNYATANAHGLYFFVNSATKRYCFYVDVDDTGTAQPIVAADVFIKVVISSDYTNRQLGIAVGNAFAPYRGLDGIDVRDYEDDDDSLWDGIAVENTNRGTLIPNLIEKDVFPFGTTTLYTGGPDSFNSAYGGNLTITDLTLTPRQIFEFSNQWILIETDTSGQNFVWGKFKIDENIFTANYPEQDLDSPLLEPFFGVVSFTSIYNPLRLSNFGFFSFDNPFKAYFGLIHCNALKFLDLQKASVQKYLQEVQITAENVDPNGSFRFGFHKNLNETPHQWLTPQSLEGDEGSRNYVITGQQLDSGPYRTSGISLDERGFEPLEIQAVTLSFNSNN